MSLGDVGNQIKHIAFIMDGNGRWATERKKRRSFGHLHGVKAVRPVVETCFFTYNIFAVSLFVFSSENWKRSEGEITYLFKLLKRFFNTMLKIFLKRGVRITVSGDLKDPRIPEDVLKTIEDAMEKTKMNNERVFNILFNYGGQNEILYAVKEIAKDVKDGVIKNEDIDLKTIQNHLYQPELPMVDLLIRTSGEERISNCLLYELAYAELIFNPCYWPSYTPEVLANDIEEFLSRHRRYGGVKDE